jgi:hypothetical protein
VTEPLKLDDFDDAPPLKLEDFEDASAPSAPRPRTTAGQAFGLGTADGASMGFADEASGLGAWLASKFNGGDIPRASGRGVDAPISDTTDYEAGRNEFRADEDAAANEHALAYRGGQGVGIVGTAMAPIPGGQALGRVTARVAPRVAGALIERGVGETLANGLGRVAQRAAVAAPTGAALGALNAAGDSEASLTRNPGQLRDDVVHGAEMGALAGPIVGEGVHQAMKVPGAIARGIGKANTAIGDAFGRGANKEAVAAAGPQGNDTRKLMRDFGDTAVNDFGQSIRDQNLGGKLPGTGWDTYAKNAEKQMAELGPAIGEATKRADAQGVRINSGSIVSDLLDRASELENLPQVPAIKAQIDDLLENAVAIDSAGAMSFGQAVEFRRKLDDIAWDAAAAKQSQTAKDARELAGKMRGAIDDSLKQADPALRDELSALNQRYSTAARVHKYATTRVAKEAGLQIGGLTGKLASGLGFAHGMMHGGPVMAAQEMAAGYAADKLIKERGHDIASKTLGAGQALFSGAGNVMRRAADATGSAIERSPVAQAMGEGVQLQAAGRAPSSMFHPEPQAATADDGTDDPQYGTMLAAHAPGQQRSIMYSTLMLQDPAFRERRRKRAQDEQTQEGNEP